MSSMDKTFIVQVCFSPENIQFKTMKTMDRQARLAMMPDYEMYCVDLKEGAAEAICHQICLQAKYSNL